jgi:hypothetical protein
MKLKKKYNYFLMIEVRIVVILSNDWEGDEGNFWDLEILCLWAGCVNMYIKLHTQDL